MLAISITGLAINSLGQKSQANDEDQYQSEETEEVVMIVRVSSAFDTLFIPAGKAIVFLIEVDENSSGMISLNGDLTKEEKELINNFGNNAFEIKVISKNTYVQFENKKVLNISWASDLYQGFAYWSGKLGDDVKVKKGSHFSTEFVSEQMGLKKESSYVINTRRYKAELTLLQNKNIFTEKSKIVMNAYLSNISSAFPENNQDPYGDLFNHKSLKLKSIETCFYIKGSKIPLKKTLLNEKGQPTLIKFYSMNGNERSSLQFIYENDILSQIVNEEGEIIYFIYNNEKMIMLQTIRNGKETKVFTLVNNLLLCKSYEVMDNDNSYDNWFWEEKYEGNCKVTYSNDIVSSKDSSSKIGTFPFIHQSISYQDSMVLQFKKSKIEKKDDKNFVQYYSKATQEDQEDEYELFGTFQFNEHNLISTFTFTKDNETNLLKMDYTYYP